MYRLLIVEDEYLQQETLKSLINSNIGEVKVVGIAEDGQEALEKFHKVKPDIVLMDIHIPKLDGLKASKAMKKANPKLAVIILTAYSEFDYAQEAISINVDDYLLKPVKLEDLKASITRSIEKLKSQSLAYKPEDMTLLSFKNNYINLNLAEAKEDFYKLLADDILYYQPLAEIKDYFMELVDSLYDNYIVERDQDCLDLYRGLENSRSKARLLRNFVLMSRHILSKILELDSGKEELDLSLQYIELNLKEKLQLQDVASFVHISPTYYSKLFKERLGLNFIDYLTSRRMETAKMLLEFTDFTVSEVSSSVGFNESNYFSRVFKEKVGMSPSDYRASYKNPNIL